MKCPTPDEWTTATGDVLEGEGTGSVPARPELTWCPPQPDIYLNRQCWTVARYGHADETEGARQVSQIAEAKIRRFLKEEGLAGRRHTQNRLEDAKVLPQAATRQTVRRLLKDNLGRSDKE